MRALRIHERGPEHLVEEEASPPTPALERGQRVLVLGGGHLAGKAVLRVGNGDGSARLESRSHRRGGKP